MQNMMKSLMGDMFKGVGDVNTLDLMKDMNPTKFGLQILAFQKNAFENVYNTMQQTQQQIEKLAEPLMKTIPGVPEELNNILQKSQEDIKKAVDESFVKAEAFLSSTCSPAKEEKTKSKAQPKAK